MNSKKHSFAVEMGLVCVVLATACSSGNPTGADSGADSATDSSADAAGDSAADASGAGAGSVTGTVAGTSLAVADAISFDTVSHSVSTGDAGNTTQAGTSIDLVSVGGICADIGQGKQPKNLGVLAMYLATVSSGGDTASVASPGTFPISASSPISAGPPGNASSAQWITTDATCTATSTNATTGSVTVTSVSASQITGTFDLTFGADHVTGSFEAPNCAAGANAPGSQTCF